MPRKELAVQPREVLGKKVAVLRREGLMPANIYGRGLESVAIQINADEVEKTMRAATANEVLDVKIAGEPAARPVVIHHIQRHPLTSGILHLDFYQVSLREKMRADVPITIVGQSNAVETYNGVLMTGIEVLHIEALPLDIPTHIEVDISALRQLEDAVHVRDLVVPANVTVLSDEDVVIVKVASPRVSGDEGDEVAAVAAPELAGDASEPEASAEESSEDADSEA